MERDKLWPGILCKLSYSSDVGNGDETSLPASLYEFLFRIAIVPSLIPKCLQRQWRVLKQLGDPSRGEVL